MKSLDGVNKKNDVNNTASEAPEKNVKTEPEKIDFSKVKIEESYPHDEAHRLKSIDSTPFINPVWLI